MISESIESNLQSMFVDYFHSSVPQSVVLSELPRSGGDRRYFRMSDGTASCIGTFTPDASEGKCFVALSDDFRKADCAVPVILSHSDDFRFYLQEDLGVTSLFSLLNEGNFDMMVDETLHRLVQLQKTPTILWTDDVANPDFCRRQVMWDLNYFKYEYAKPSGVLFDENLLEDDFELLCSRLLGVPVEYWGFMMRDCQSRNVMVTPSGPVFIDFQGGRRGPVLYDAVSFLWQARAGFPDKFRDVMLWRYAKSFCDDDKDSALVMLSHLPQFVIFRTLQVLGAYGFRGLVQKRAHFILSIPGALSNLEQIVQDDLLDDYPELKRLSISLIKAGKKNETQKSGKLKVEVFSFSYKKGYPDDMSGNGGGFMFDCRSMHNPGRYQEYRHLTGRDTSVVRFLEKRGEVHNFLKNAWSLTDPAVERYISRGFSNLQIGFGCTGGQHRSVYCAEATAKHLQNLFPEADIRLIHREHP